MVNNNYIALDKTTLIGWVDKTLNQSFTKKNIMLRFKVTGISRLNLSAMDEKKNHNNLYITMNTNKKENANSISNEDEDDDIQ